MKTDYDKELIKLLDKIDYIPKLLLHSCCGPCSSYVITFLTDYFDITVLYYNPNIEPKEEYEKRKKEQIKLIKNINTNNQLDFLEIDYLNEEFKDIVKGYEMEIEGGKRCDLCFQLRLEKTAQIAKEKKYDFFATTLTVSPYKNASLINNIGINLALKYDIKWLVSDFKKRDGYKKSIEISKLYNLYRQHYCGCLYSKEQCKDE